MSQQPGYFVLDHPADMGIEAFGANLAQAFEQAAIGMMSVILDLSSVNATDVKTIEIQSTDPERLLVRWLNEILYLYDGQQFVPKEITIERIFPTSLSATLKGEPLSAEKHRTQLDVKAVTYHQLYVKETEGEVRVQVFLDI